MGQNTQYVPSVIPGTNPGGKYKEKKLSKHNEKFIALTADIVSEEDWREIIEKAVDQAKSGNAGARAWLGNYLLGVPRQVPEHDLEHNVNIFWNAPRPEPEIKVIEGEVTSG